MFKRLTIVVGVFAFALFPLVWFLHSRASSTAQALDLHPPSHSLWHCGMHPQVIEDHPGDCPICHMALTPLTQSSASSGAPKRILYWWDPMLGASSISSKPGKSAMGMEMIPVYESEMSAGPMVAIDPVVVQNMGVRTAKVEKGPLTVTIRAVGMLAVPQSALYDISLRVGGWAEKVYADIEGMHVHKGEVLFDLYSPDLQVAAEELIAASAAVKALPADSSSATAKDANDLLTSARRKLNLWGVDEADISAIAASGKAPRTVPFRSPADGDVIDDTIVQGSAVSAGAKLMRIEDHSHLWLDAQVYAAQIPMTPLGADVEATIDGISGKTFAGKVSFIYPHLDHMTRTVGVRTTLDNPEQALKPGMYATVTITSRPKADVLLIPREAVIDTGARQIVFVSEADGHFSPRLVKTGTASGDDRIQILEGLAPGERVVTSGQFLMDVESRTAEAVAKLGSSSSDIPRFDAAGGGMK